MAQSTVKQFYNTRKRGKVVEDLKLIEALPGISIDKNCISHSKTVKNLKATGGSKNEKDTLQDVEILKIKPKKTVQKKPSSKTKEKNKKSNAKQTKVTSFYQTECATDKRKVTRKNEELQVNASSCNTQKKNAGVQKVSQSPKQCLLSPKELTPSKEKHNVVKGGINFKSRENPLLNVTKIPSSPVQRKLLYDLKYGGIPKNSYKSDNATNEHQILQSPKRNLQIPDEGTPPKKRFNVVVGKLNSEEDNENSSLNIASSKFQTSPVRRKLILDDSEDADVSKPIVSNNDTKLLDVGAAESQNGNKTPSKNEQVFHSPKRIIEEALINQSRAKLLSSTRLDDLKKSLASFNEKAFKIKEFQSNPYKITSVASSSKVNLKASPAKSNLKASPVKHAYEKFSYLAEPESTTLTLPIKYKVLCEMFRSMDTVVSILYNRKEEITFEKVREGVQKMMKRNFGKNHLGQIVTIYPSAYTLTLKNFLKKTSTGEYKLVISPMLSENEDRKDSKSTAFVPMHGQCLINRRKEFNNSILKLVKSYHQEFLIKINFGTVLNDELKHWHPKFALDSVPDVQIAKIPEPPESKISTAKDVLKIIKGSTIKSSKIEDALQKVANKSAGDDNITANIAKTDTKKSALKGICSDLLEKIRARESARCLEIMSRSPDETKKKAMLEQLPRIIDILWHYFTSERKGAISIDTVVEKIIYSLNSLTMADEVKEHLKLITETFPGWLTFIEIPKGVYLRIDKKRNITEMLANFEH